MRFQDFGSWKMADGWHERTMDYGLPRYEIDLIGSIGVIWYLTGITHSMK